MRLRVLKWVLLISATSNISLLSTPLHTSVNLLIHREMLAIYFMCAAIVAHNLALQGEHSTLFTGKICDSTNQPYQCYILRMLVLSKFEKLARTYQGKIINLKNNGVNQSFLQATAEVIRNFENIYETGKMR